MAENKNIILDVSLNRSKIAKDIIETQKEIDKLSATIAATNEKIKNSTDEKQTNKLRKELVLLNSDMRQLVSTEKNHNKEIDLINKANVANAGSYEQLLRVQQIAQTRLKLLEGTIQRNADGTFTLSEAYKAQAEKVKEAKDAILAFDKGISDGRTNVGNYSKSIVDASKELGLFGGAFGQIRQVVQGFKSVGSVISQTTEGITNSVDNAATSVANYFSVSEGGAASAGTFTSSSDAMTDAVGETSEALNAGGKAQQSFGVKGANAWKAIRVAFISSGIGAIILVVVAAIGALVAYFTKSEEGAEKLEQAFAGIGAVVDVIIGTLVKLGGFIVELFTNFDEAIKKISFKNLANFFSDTVDQAKTAANAAVELKKREQELDDVRRNAILTNVKLRIEADRLRKVESDKTKTTAERLEASKKASELEKKILEKNIAIAEEELAIIEGKNKLLKENGQLRDEDLEKAINAEASLLQLSEELKNKDETDRSDRSKLQKKDQQDAINSQIALLNNELKFLEKRGEATITLQKQIAAKERAASLLASDLGAGERLKIESDYKLKLLEIDEAFAKQREEFLQQAEDLRISRIVDGATREIANEVATTRGKLQAIKGNSKEEIALRGAIAQESALKIADIQKKYAEKTAKENLDVIKQNAAILKSEQDAKVLEEENALRISLSNKEITEQEFQQRSFALKEAAIEQELNLQLQAQAARQLNDQKFYNESEQALFDQLETIKISTAEYNAAIEVLNKEFSDRENLTEAETQAQINATLKALQQTRVDSQVDANAKRVDDSNKTAELQRQAAEIETQSLQDVLAFISESLGKDEAARKKNAVAIKALAIGEVLINLNKELSAIALYASQNPANAVTFGAAGTAVFTAQGIAAGIRAGLAIAKISSQKFAEGGSTVGGGKTDSLTNVLSRYSPSNVGSFSGGGLFSSPSIGLIGEEGAELVVRNKVLQQEPEFFNMIERWNRSGVRPFADGGFTSSKLSSPLFDSDQLIENIARAVANTPAPIVTIEDFNIAQNRVNVIEANANI
jgi:hypothetical protein